MKKAFQLLLFTFSLAACGGEAAVPTPPIVPAHTATSTPLAGPATAVIPPTEPVPPTAVPATAVTPPPPTESPNPPAPLTQVQLVPVATSGLNLPLYLTHAGDERLFVVQQNGLIRIIQDGAVIEEPFLNLRDRVGAEANEQGLLSVAFHPQYARNGYFYVNYTNRQFHTVIARFQVSTDDPNRADPASEQILLTVDQPYPNHNGGLVLFGPDGYLYIGMGDGGSAGDPEQNGQDAGTLLGAILRIDVDHTGDGVPYAIPDSNPFIADEGKRNEIWAIGVRNPWRFSFDRQTGDFYLADVGQNAWEEVNFLPAGHGGGANFGWNIMEGSHCFRGSTCASEGLVLPIFEYEHSQGCSVTGGHVYRGQAYPEMQGNYFLADFCSGLIWRLLRQPDGRWQPALVLESGLAVTSFGEDVNGMLYVVDRSGGIYELRP